MNTVAIEKDRFGTTADGVAVDRYTLRNAGGMTVRLITYGATVTELLVPDRNGKLADVVLGFDNLAQYETPEPLLRLHGRPGRVSHHRREVHARRQAVPPDDQRRAAPFARRHQGPQQGGLAGRAAGGLRRAGREAHLQEPRRRPGLSGQSRRDRGLHAHRRQRAEDRVYRRHGSAHAGQLDPSHLLQPGGAGCGRRAGPRAPGLRRPLHAPGRQGHSQRPRSPPVAGTPLDFRTPTAIGDRMKPGSEVAGGYDAELPGRPPGSRAGPGGHARAPRPTAGVLDVLSTEPAMVLYTGNYLDGTLRGKQGAVYGKHAGVCLETAHLPDSVNRPEFPSIILRPGQTYRQTCIYRFSVR